MSDLDFRLQQLIGDELLRDVPMARHTTLRVGGPARWLWIANDTSKLADTLVGIHELGVDYLFVGHGSNLLMSDKGYNGLVILNRCKRTEIGDTTYCDSGVSLGSLFHQTARAGYGGLEWAVGIPGTVGGALVSNAGAYRGNIGPLVRSVRVFANGKDETVGAEWMEFSYRDSRLRRDPNERAVILSCTLALEKAADLDMIVKAAKDYQNQRRNKQPYDPSAGSFFKNVYNRTLADSLPTLPASMREAGVVPAGYLIEACALKGTRVGEAQISERHANFLVNATKDATATDLHRLATLVKQAVREKFGVTLEEEVLYCGDWSGVSNGGVERAD